MLTLLFDIDGTLITTGGAGTASLRTAMNSAFGIASPVTVEVSGRTDRSIIRDLFMAHAIEESTGVHERFQMAYLEQLPKMLATLPGRVLPGVSELLARVASQETVLVGLLTRNTQAGARIKLTHHGLMHHFSFGGYGDRHFSRDDVAREALAEAGRQRTTPIDPRRVWVIGDTPLDVRCARAIGARVLAVATGTHRIEELAAERPDALRPDLAGADIAQLLLEDA